MLILSWNVHAIYGIGARRFENVMASIASMQPDIVMLQEVARQPELVDRFGRGLSSVGLPGFFYSGTMQVERKKYGNIVASRSSLRPEGPGWAPGVPWHQLLCRATVTLNGTAIDVIAAHMPNGSANGWKKIETFEALAAYLRDARRGPRLVGGDFNEPQAILENGTLVSFGSRKTRDGEFDLGGIRKRNGEAHPRVRWDQGVRSVLDGEAEHGLRRAYSDRHGPRTEVTHVIRGKSRFFDHILVSSHFEVQDAGYRHDWREAGLSDHSAAWVIVEASKPAGPG